MGFYRNMKKLIIGVLIIFILLLPLILWIIKPSTVLTIAVIDKTVPLQDYREHNGLFWILEHYKIIKPDGELYDIGRDYFGYDPYDQKANESFHADRPLDLIYIADTYGVYNDDLKELPEGERSKKLYGGMNLLEWNKIIESKLATTTLIAEFNSFASPTDETTRSVMEKNLGIKWSGWTGRYFDDLNNDDIPPWLIRNFEQQYEKKWMFDGAGLAFVHTSDKVIIVESNGTKENVTFQMTEQGLERFVEVQSSPYMYWFDIVAPIEGSSILGEYELHISNEQKKILEDNGIPLNFPAIIHNQNNKTYYFAGDYADYKEKTFAKLLGIDRFLKVFANGDSDFYWSTYVPLMNKVLEQIIVEKEMKK